jgi:hypothetical protein
MSINGIQRYIPFFSKLTAVRTQWKKKYVKAMLTPLSEALAELERRRKDPELIKKIEAFLQDSVPEYAQTGPVLCLARHLATPNFETLRFTHLLESLPYRVMITKDTHDRFVTVNPMKRALGKLPIHMGYTQRQGKYVEQFQYISIIDMNAANGKPLKDIVTLWGQPLSEFHDELCNHFFHNRVEIVDDADWINGNHRGDLLEHYKKFLTLFLTHGILFEDYVPDDAAEQQFVKKILRPAFTFVERRFGVRPLVTSLDPTLVESDLFWISYPKAVLDIVQRKMGKKA